MMLILLEIELREKAQVVVVALEKSLITCSSKKQNIIAFSIAEAEYVSAAN